MSARYVGHAHLDLHPQCALCLVQLGPTTVPAYVEIRTPIGARLLCRLCARTVVEAVVKRAAPEPSAPSS